MPEAIEKHHSLPAIHPGQILNLDIMKPEKLSAAILAKAMGVSADF